MIISAFGFLIGRLQQNQTYIFNLFVFQECGRLWRVVWLWRISGGCSHEMVGFVFSSTEILN